MSALAARSDGASSNVRCSPLSQNSGPIVTPGMVPTWSLMSRPGRAVRRGGGPGWPAGRGGLAGADRGDGGLCAVGDPDGRHGDHLVSDLGRSEQLRLVAGADGAVRHRPVHAVQLPVRVDWRDGLRVPQQHRGDVTGGGAAGAAGRVRRVRADLHADARRRRVVRADRLAADRAGAGRAPAAAATRVRPRDRGDLPGEDSGRSVAVLVGGMAQVTSGTATGECAAAPGGRC